MKLNAIEFMAMNNSVRDLIMRKIEFPKIRMHLKLKEGLKVLEIGCGTGNGSRLAYGHYKPSEYHATDLDPKMVRIAKRKSEGYDIRFEAMDATRMRFKNNSFDAAFDFGAIHHIPGWEGCLKELRRVVRPGGIIMIEDLSIESFETVLGKMMRALSKHPYEKMYRKDEFIAKLKELGFKIEFYRAYHPYKIIKYFLVIARKKKGKSL